MQSIGDRFRFRSLASPLSSFSLHLLFTAVFVRLAGHGVVGMERELLMVLDVG
jgi:hypothetical protein